MPHRYPFLLIDRIIEMEPGKSLVAIKNVSMNEPFFTGHFPIRPVMPGVLILEALAQAAGINLQLSGHTHRAQMQPVSFMPRLVYKGFDYGLKHSGPMQVLISSGVGTWGPPLRVGTQSEIMLLTFE